MPESSRPALFVTVSTPWAIRNYFHTGIVRRLAKHARVTALTTERLAACLRRDGHTSYIAIATWESGPEPLRWRLARQLRKKLYMETRGIHTETIWRRYSQRPLYQRLSDPVIASAARHLDAKRSLELAWALDLKINQSDVFQRLFRDGDSALLFATYADMYFDEAVVRSAQASGVPAVLMVLSWDHLSTKVVLNRAYRRILVWTDLQREEVLRNYPWYKPEQVRVVGIPHYDLYFQPTATSRERWCVRHGLDPAKRTLVFYTMPQRRHDSQHLIVERAAAAIEKGEELPKNLQILIKCHPFDDPACYSDVLARHVHVRMLPTTLCSGAHELNWQPDPDEIEKARDCLTFADVTSNIYSTVTIEAALFNKPTIHIAFDAAPLPPGRVPCREYYNFTHFKPIVETDAAPLVYSQEQFHSALREALETPSARSAERRALTTQFAGPMDGRSSERVVRELLEMLSPAHELLVPDRPRVRV
jgi:hypothetical protein